MPNTKTAKKSTRKIARKTAVNKMRRSRMRTFIRSVETAIRSNDKPAAQEALRRAQPEIMRAAQKNVVHKNTAARTMSRLSAHVRAMEG